MGQNMKYFLLSWKITIAGYPEYTGCIVDENNKIVDTIDFLFTSGSYSKEMLEKQEKYELSMASFGPDQDHFTGLGLDITAGQAIEEYLQERAQEKRITEFLTPEKTQEILNSFKKGK